MAGTSTQSTLAQLTSAVPTALQNLASPGASTSSSSSGLGGILGLLTGQGSGNSALDNFWNEWGPNANIWNTIFSSGFYMPSNTLGAFTSLMSAGGGSAAAAEDALGGAASEALGGAAAAAPLGSLGSVGGLGSLGSGVSAALGQGLRSDRCPCRQAGLRRPADKWSGRGAGQYPACHPTGRRGRNAGHAAGQRSRQRHRLRCTEIRLPSHGGDTFARRGIEARQS
ncbi:PPE family domain protein [Mycobacterium xenopi 4042]|uniref:PPE family domain protein n=1 Tax=Mycobacterium xenopi 4042 TaxID=1299334 RepID=X8BGP5_MYCXE|nr:PPE family domain protein [Mycobacterium xenopi 4042]